MQEMEALVSELLCRMKELLHWLNQTEEALQREVYASSLRQSAAEAYGVEPERLLSSMEQAENLRSTLVHLEAVLHENLEHDCMNSGAGFGAGVYLQVTVEPMQAMGARVSRLCEACSKEFAALENAAKGIATAYAQESIMQRMDEGRALCRRVVCDAEGYADRLREIADVYMAADCELADIISGNPGMGGERLLAGPDEWQQAQDMDESAEESTATESPDYELSDMIAGNPGIGEERLLAGSDLEQTEEGSESAAESSNPAPLDDVQFRLAAPAALKRDEYALVKFMMYEGDDYARADREAQQLADAVKQNSSSLYPVARGERMRVCLQSEDVEIEEPSQELVWNGKYASCDFEVLVPEGFARKQARIKARVYQGFVVLTDLRLILNVTGEQPVSEPAETCHYRSAFLSYASQDRPKVIGCLRGMRLMRDDIDIFLDVISLRRGEYYEQRIMEEIERRDLFYLFWSRNAAASKWVEKELQYALANKSSDRIEPVPLEAPEVCPPPRELGDRHFNDWLLRYEQQLDTEA